MHDTGIYRYTNLITGKHYIGSAISFSSRWSSHISKLRRNAHYNNHLQSAFNKYGEENFKFFIVELVDSPDLLLEREQYWIDKHKSYEEGYNILRIAGNSLGYKHTNDAKEKMSIMRKGVSHSVGEDNPCSVLTEKSVVEIKNMLKNNICRLEIANTFNVSRATIDLISTGDLWRHVEVEGFIPSSEPKKIDERDVVEIKKMLMNGAKQKDLAVMFGVSETQISAINNGVRWSSVAVEGFKTIENKAKKKLDREGVLEIRRLLEKEVPQKVIAKRFGVSVKTVSGIKTGKIHNTIR